MKDVLREELDDLQLFADPFEEFKHSSNPGGWTASFVRKGEEVAVRRESNGAMRTIRGPGQRKYRSFRSLLVSATFANVERLASAQLHLTRHLADPETGRPKEYLSYSGEIRRTAGSSDLTFESVRGELDRPEDRLRVFVVNGVAGVGKSHLIERIVRSRAVPGSYKLGKPLLLHVESRGKVLTSLNDRIAGTLSNLRAAFVEEELKPLIRRGAIQIAIDGFDELSDSRGYVRAWGALRDFVRDLRGCGTCILAGRDTMLDAEAVRNGLGHTVADEAVTFLHVRHPPAEEVRRWLSHHDDWRGKERELAVCERQVETSEYLRRPFFVSQIAALGPSGFEETQGEPISDLMDGIVRREGERLTGPASDIDSSTAAELYRQVLSETARLMVDDETNTVDVDILGLLLQEVFTDHADEEMINALALRAGAIALLEESAADRNKRSFPHETVRSYFFAQSIFDGFFGYGATVGLHRVPLSAEDFRIFNRVARRRSIDEQGRLRQALRARLREANGHDYLRPNIGGLLLAFAPLEGECEGDEDRLAISNLELSDVWMADLLGAQEVTLDGCKIHRLDVRGADLTRVQFIGVMVGELVVDRYVRFGSSAPAVVSLFVYEHFSETRWPGPPEEWIGERIRKAGLMERENAERSPVWELLERFARISMRQYAIRSEKDNNDQAARRILDSPYWPELREILRRHKRIEIPEHLDASGPRSEWFHLVAGAEFLDAEAAVQDSTKAILEELGGAKRK